MSYKPLVDVSLRDDVTRCDFLDSQLSNKTEFQAVFRYLNERVVMNPGMRVVLGFENVTHVSSTFLSALNQLGQQVMDNNCKLELDEVDEQLFEVFLLTRINQKFQVNRKTKNTPPATLKPKSFRQTMAREQTNVFKRFRDMVTDMNYFNFKAHQMRMHKQLKLAEKEADQKEEKRRMAG